VSIASFQRDPRYENRRLLDLAHRVECCVNCDRRTPKGCEPAHSNLQRHGRGHAHKSHDHHHCALCHDCALWLDYGKTSDPTGIWEPSRESKAQFFAIMQDRTMHIYWTNGWLEVKR
jgi:hypothetical protein